MSEREGDGSSVAVSTEQSWEVKQCWSEEAIPASGGCGGGQWGAWPGQWEATDGRGGGGVSPSLSTARHLRPRR